MLSVHTCAAGHRCGDDDDDVQSTAGQCCPRSPTPPCRRPAPPPHRMQRHAARCSVSCAHHPVPSPLVTLHPRTRLTLPPRPPTSHMRCHMHAGHLPDRNRQIQHRWEAQGQGQGPLLRVRGCGSVGGRAGGWALCSQQQGGRRSSADLSWRNAIFGTHEHAMQQEFGSSPAVLTRSPSPPPSPPPPPPVLDERRQRLDRRHRVQARGAGAGVAHHHGQARPGSDQGVLRRLCLQLLHAPRQGARACHAQRVMMVTDEGRMGRAAAGAGAGVGGARLRPRAGVGTRAVAMAHACLPGWTIMNKHRCF